MVPRSFLNAFIISSRGDWNIMSSISPDLGWVMVVAVDVVTVVCGGRVYIVLTVVGVNVVTVTRFVVVVADRSVVDVDLRVVCVVCVVTVISVVVVDWHSLSSSTQGAVRGSHSS